MLFYLWGVLQEEEEKKKLQDRIDDASKEIERLKNDIKRITNICNEKIKIINDVREKIENTTINCDGVAEDLIDDIYEILGGEIINE